MNSLPSAIEPTIFQNEINEPIHIIDELSSTMRATDKNGDTSDFYGRLILRWLPTPRVFIEGKFDFNKPPLFLEIGQECEAELHEEGLKTNIKLSEKDSTVNSKGKGWVRFWPLEDIADVYPHEQLNQIKFSVPNLPFYVGKPITTPNINRQIGYSGRLELQIDDWIIVLDQISNHKTIKEELKEYGGYAVTYGGEIKKINDEQFTCAEGKKVLKKLSELLTFVSGRKTHPIIPVGITSKGKEKYIELALPLIDRWEMGAGTFVDTNKPITIESLAPSFFNLIDNEPWKSNIPQLLYWYTFANRNVQGAGTDGSIVIAVAALEQLAWLVLGESYKRNELQRNLRKTFEELQLPNEIPDHLEDLKHFAKQKDWHGGSSKVLAEFRNEIVHPDRQGGSSGNINFEGLSLALWYMETAILSLCNYEGPYRNRTKIGGCVGDTEYFKLSK